MCCEFDLETLNRLLKREDGGFLVAGALVILGRRRMLQRSGRGGANGGGRGSGEALAAAAAAVAVGGGDGGAEEGGEVRGPWREDGDGHGESEGCHGCGSLSLVLEREREV